MNLLVLDAWTFLFHLPAVLGVLVGGWMLWRSKPGPPEADPSHPHCDRCGFDVSSAGNRCSECGADLARPGAIYFGRRPVRMRLQTVGTWAMIGVPMIWYAAATYPQWGAPSVLHFGSWSLVDAHLLAGGGMADAAMQEGIGRFREDPSHAPRLQRWVDRATREYHAGSTRRDWTPLFDLILMNELPLRDDQHAPLWDPIIVPGGNARASVRQGEPLPFRFSVSGGVPSNLSQQVIGRRLRFGEMTLGGEPLHTPHRQYGGTAFFGSRMGPAGFGAGLKTSRVPRHVEPGVHRFEATWYWEVVALDKAIFDQDKQKVYYTKTHRWSQDVRVVAADEPLVERVDDPDAAAAVQRQLSLQDGRFDRRLLEDGTVYIQGMLLLDGPTTHAVSGKIVIDGHPVPDAPTTAGRFGMNDAVYFGPVPAGQQRGYGIMLRLGSEAADVDTLTLRLVPDGQASADSSDGTDTILGHEFVLPDVPVRNSRW